MMMMCIHVDIFSPTKLYNCTLILGGSRKLDNNDIIINCLR